MKDMAHQAAGRMREAIKPSAAGQEQAQQEEGPTATMVHEIRDAAHDFTAALKVRDLNGFPLAGHQ
jgi:hypothetical protein